MGAALRWVRRLCFATSAACLVAAAVSPGAHAATNLEAGRPQVYTGFASASGVHQQTDKQGGVAATAEPFFSSYPEAVSLFGSDVSKARASTYYPGATLPGLGGIGCNQIISKFPLPPAGECPPPPYPFSVTAPTTDGKADASTPTGQQLGGQGAPATIDATSATAHADRVYASADAVDSGSRQTTGAGTGAAVLAFRQAVAAATGGPAAAAAVAPRAADSSSMTFGQMHVDTKVSFPDPKNDALLVAYAEATVTGVDFLGGAVHADSVTTISTFRTDGISPPVHDDHVTVSGATAGGQPAVIDNNGVNVLGADQGKPALKAINDALHTLFTATGSGIRLVNPSTSPSSGPPPALNSESFATPCGKGEADGVQFYQQANASSVPLGGVYYVNSTIGSACTDAYASSQRGLAPGPIETPTIPDLTPGSVSPVVAGVSSESNATSGVVTQSGSGLPTRQSAGVPRRTAAGGRLGFLEADLRLGRITDRLGWLYLALTLSFLGLCLGSRFVVPARLPRHR